jgi:hypothetical protein
MNRRLKLFDLLKKESDSMFPNSHSVFTPRQVTEDMLSSADLTVGNILVLFNVEFLIALIEVFGIDPKEITFYSDHKNKSYLAKKFNVNIITQLTDQKYNVIVSNPPFNHLTNSSVKLWTNTVVKSVECLEDDGQLLLITPVTWLRKPAGKTFKKATKLFSKYHLEFVKSTQQLNKDIKAGDTVCFWKLNKTINNSKTSFVLNYMTFDAVYTEQVISLNDEQRMYDTISKKFLSTNNTKMRDVYYSDYSYSTKRAIKEGDISYQKTLEHTQPLFVTASQQAYTKPEKVKSGIKLILNCSGYYFKKGAEDKYMPISDCIGVGEAGIGLPVNSFEEAKRARSLLSTKLYTYYVNNEKTGGFNTGIGNLPVLDLSVDWDDKKVAKFFNLSQNEVDFIEKSVDRFYI